MEVKFKAEEQKHIRNDPKRYSKVKSKVTRCLKIQDKKFNQVKKEKSL